jgi:hypothetical protein
MYCYMVMPGYQNQQQADSMCKSQGFMGLVLWSNGYDQLDLETYFLQQGSLPTTGYWLGIARKGFGASYNSLLDNSPYDGSDPMFQSWTHWSWRQPAAARNADEHCAAALVTDRWGRPGGRRGLGSC